MFFSETASYKIQSRGWLTQQQPHSTRAPRFDGVIVTFLNGEVKFKNTHSSQAAYVTAAVAGTLLASASENPPRSFSCSFEKGRLSRAGSRFPRLEAAAWGASEIGWVAAQANKSRTFAELMAV